MPLEFIPYWPFFAPFLAPCFLACFWCFLPCVELVVVPLAGFFPCFLANAGMESVVAMASAAMSEKNFFIGCTTSDRDNYAACFPHARCQTPQETATSVYLMCYEKITWGELAHAR